VAVVRRTEIADPEGETVLRALHDLGFGEVEAARFDRTITLQLADTDPEMARARVEEMCRRLLANPVIEDFSIDIDQ
jgi:phosphoribosylformylglycinamidine synthase